jgi:CelD/BcsL family acetyltransferase involved in cellulose biosynthesis
LAVETIESVGGLRALEAEWRVLEARLPRLPFVTFDWLLTWWENLAEDRLLIRDQLHVLAIRDAHGGLVAVAPLMLTLRPGVERLAVRQLQLFGADPNLTEIRTLAVADSERLRVYAALVRHLQGQAQRWDWFLLTGVPSADELKATVEQSFARVKWLRSVPDYTLALPASYAAFKLSLSRNIKESLRKCYNSLKRNGLSFEFRALSDVDDVGHALEHFFRLHRLRAALPGTVPHPDVFAAESSCRFLRAVCRRFAERGKLRVFQLKIGDRVVATRIGFLCEDCLYLYYSGYDPAFKQYSVMTTLVAESIRFAIEHGLATVNLSTGRDVSKLRWGPRETEYGDALIVTPSLRGQIAYDLCAAAKQTLLFAQQHTRALDALTRRAEPRSTPPSAAGVSGSASAPPSESSAPPSESGRPPVSEATARGDAALSERSLRASRLGRG